MSYMIGIISTVDTKKFIEWSKKEALRYRANHAMFCPDLKITDIDKIRSCNINEVSAYN